MGLLFRSVYLAHCALPRFGHLAIRQCCTQGGCEATHFARKG